MAQKRIEVGVSVIIHATEDHGRVLEAISDTLGVEPDAFDAVNTSGHFDNPITIYDADVSGRDARRFVVRFSDALSEDDMPILASQIDERTVNSRFHIRVDKQVLVRDNRIEIVGLRESPDGNSKDVIKIKIHTPIYNKKNTARIFEEILHGKVDE